MYAQLSSARQKQLDSLVTNLPREAIRNLDSAHFYMYNAGLNDEERVFMFYGFFGIHFKYDYKRLADGNSAKEYTPYYTCKRRSGVCRDFAALFKELCDRSNIPCVVAGGRVTPRIKRWMMDLVTFRMNSPTHAWNIVKYNDSWHLMDPTWTQVQSIDKYYSTDENGRRKYVTRAKRPNRKYYDTEPHIFYDKRSAELPAFYLMDSAVPTYRTADRGLFRKKIYANWLEYNDILDSLSTNPWYVLREDYSELEKSYCGKYGSNGFEWHYLSSFLELKRSPYDPLSIELCETQIERLMQLSAYLQSTNNKNYNRIPALVDELRLYIEKQRRREQRLSNR